MLRFKRQDALDASVPVPCDSAVEWLADQAYMAKQVAALDLDALRRYLKSFGAWDAEELADDGANIMRAVWTGACDVREAIYRKDASPCTVYLCE